MEDELEKCWKEAFRGYSRCYPGISLEGLKKTTRILSDDRVCPGRDSNGAHPEHDSRASHVDQPVL
jgi:hypothetical protein